MDLVRRMALRFDPSFGLLEQLSIVPTLVVRIQGCRVQGLQTGDQTDGCQTSDKTEMWGRRDGNAHVDYRRQILEQIATGILKLILI